MSTTTNEDSFSHILVVGATQVGKTTFLSSLCHGQNREYDHTVQAQKYVDVNRKLIFFDTSGIHELVLHQGGFNGLLPVFHSFSFVIEFGFA
jgi:GTPase SAR1 family protein